MIYPFFLYKIVSFNGVKFIYSHNNLHSKNVCSFTWAFYEASCVTVSKAWTYQFNACVIIVATFQSTFDFS